MEKKSVIALRDVRLYQREMLVLSEVSFTIESGSFVYLVGKTGTGKSTLLQSLYGEVPIAAGEAKVAGYDLVRLSPREIPLLRRKLGIVFQDFQLLTDRCVTDNLLFVLKATGWRDKQKMADRMEAVLEMVGLKTKGYKMPHELSGGEQQRVVIARALLNNPELILADEPTGNLDPDTSHGIMQLLFDISKTGTAVLMATHDYSLFRKFPSHIIKCEGGRVNTSDYLFY
ncbi:MAG: ATP-binding cassette domain-containing protein [Bacteroidia bacterium]|nr:ATP-binding cassette domain-containing protein [Bacteroidales bacterium]NCD41548.1 ATP-binding cassette domain-containing protein [Bacteroidia bacterium]MDD2323651.1 ATP-binding cassette domain-containing protein [Bacteroidales bacterium]MDD3011805.1 ATP-binding cassette domain-containing protein [Bacteroidales bacterium]MDD3961839.1 ATP-binding cassette domain-containing protein [Bacteroidales bacterium]